MLPGVVELISFAAIPLQLFVLVIAQKAINYSEGDPTGLANRTYTWVNWLWIALGSLYWLTLFGAAAVSVGAIDSSF